MSIEAMELIAGAAVLVVAFWLPRLLSRRIQHGEARFESTTAPDRRAAPKDEDRA